MFKKILTIVISFVLTSPVLMAQTEVRVVVVPKVLVYISPAENGTEEEIEYFTRSMVMEFTASGYQIVDIKEESNYNVVMTIVRYPGEDPANDISLALFETLSGTEVISSSYGYNAVTDMDQNNLVAMTQMMANTPIVKILPNAEMLGVMDKEPEPVLVPVQEERPPHRPGFYLGLRAGGNFDLSFIQNNGGYDGGVGRGISTEGALVVEFHPLRFLSLQTEVVFLYDTFKASKVIQRGQTEIRYTETFSSFSLMIPLLIKMPVTLDNLVLSSFVGGYYLLPLNGMNNGKVGYTMDPPFGFSLGFEWGIPLNSGMVSFGLRFDHDIGMGIVEEGPQYYRERIGLFAGYKFFLGKREESPPTPAQPAAPPAEGAAPAEDAAE